MGQTEKYFSINAEGCSIRCKLYYKDASQDRVVLFGHGFGGHKDNKAAERFAGHILEKNKNVAVLTFDWPCHGDDVRKVLRLDDCSAYIRRIIAHIGERFGDPALYLYATSFGGYLFLRYLSEEGSPFEKIALRCPAVNMYDVICTNIITEDSRRLLDRGRPAPVGFDRKVEIDSAFLNSLRENDLTKRSFLNWADDILILHGAKDEIVPPAAVRAFAEDNVIEFELIEGADHRFQNPRAMDHAIARIADWFGMK